MSGFLELLSVGSGTFAAVARVRGYSKRVDISKLAFCYLTHEALYADRRLSLSGLVQFRSTAHRAHSSREPVDELSQINLDSIYGRFNFTPFLSFPFLSFLLSVSSRKARNVHIALKFIPFYINKPNKS